MCSSFLDRDTGSSEISRCFSQSLHTFCGNCSIGTRLFLSRPFPIHYFPVTLTFDPKTLLATDSVAIQHDLQSLSMPFTNRASLINPLIAELNPICYLLALLGAHHFLHFSRIRVKSLTLRLLSYIYIYGAPILDVSRSHTTTQHSR